MARERAQEPLSSGRGEKQRTKALEDMISIWLRQQDNVNSYLIHMLGSQSM